MRAAGRVDGTTNTTSTISTNSISSKAARPTTSDPQQIQAQQHYVQLTLDGRPLASSLPVSATTFFDQRPPECRNVCW